MQKIIIAVIIVVAVLIIGWAMWPSDEQPLPEPAAPVKAAPTPELTPPEPIEPTPVNVPPQTAAAEPEPEVVLPPLPDSDPFVRERLESMDLPETWVDQGDYVRRLAVLAENATRGTYPRRQLAFLSPNGAFKVAEVGEAIYMDPAGYRRYDGYVDQLESVDPAQLAGLLQTIDPLLESALEELGVEAPAGKVFESAMREVLSVPVLEGDVELIQPNVTYHFADPELESLSALKKQLLRMGPRNVERIQAYLRRLAAEMNLAV